MITFLSLSFALQAKLAYFHPNWWKVSVKTRSEYWEKNNTSFFQLTVTFHLNRNVKNIFLKFHCRSLQVEDAQEKYNLQSDALIHFVHINYGNSFC